MAMKPRKPSGSARRGPLRVGRANMAEKTADGREKGRSFADLIDEEDVCPLRRRRLPLCRGRFFSRPGNKIPRRKFDGAGRRSFGYLEGLLLRTRLAAC